jgi:hypothetical protein
MSPDFILKYLQILIRTLLLSQARQLDRIESKLDRLIALQSDSFAGSLDFDLLQEEQTTKGVIFMKLTDSQQGILTIRPVTKGGKPAPVEAGSVLWTGPSFVAITPSADGLSATAVAMGLGGDDPGGPAEEFISASADADLGTGVVTISGRVAIQVVASQAASLGIEEGPITEQVAAGPAPNPVV